ncbi:unnamed protein product [Prunus brigantina]
MEEPKGPEFSINGACLTRFNYTETNHTLSYKLPLNITLTNPYKDPFELIDTQVTAYYQKKNIWPCHLDRHPDNVSPRSQ